MLSERNENACAHCGRHCLESPWSGMGVCGHLRPEVYPSRPLGGPGVGDVAYRSDSSGRWGDAVPGSLPVDHALTLFLILCGCVGLGILLVLLTHLVTALAALAPAGVGLTLKMTRK